ncbi:MAG: ATP-binding protein [Deltaproteobacteria bacterium]|nr:ATP-binding protein [Deltaproteobacteria bacterium]
MEFVRKISTYLDKWKVEKGRKPLIVRGARQVGKTFLIRHWAKQNYQTLVYIDLERASHRQLFQILERDDFGIDLDDCLRVISDHFLPPGRDLKQALIFFDEIQNVPKLIPLLRFFYELRPELSLIVAGSYLELAMKQISQSRNSNVAFPVGRVENLYLYPLDFFEYLNAVGEDRLLARLRSVDWNNLPTPDVHLRACEQFDHYFLIGGMPEIVAAKVQGATNDKIARIFHSLFDGYVEDIAKYGVRDSRIKYLEHLLQNVPTYAGRLINFEGFGGSAYRSREIGQAFEILESIMLVTLAQACSDAALPWNPKPRKQKKLIALDTGLVNFRSGVSFSEVKTTDLNELHRGRLAEQVVGQQLVCNQLFHRGSLYYWIKDYREGSAEVDFCLELGGKPYAIEVKSGAAGSLKSLLEFGRKVTGAQLIRIHSGEMCMEERGNLMIKSIPFYLLPRIQEIGLG